jgi:hypothetical protein
VNYITKLLDKKERKKAASAAGGSDEDDLDADETAAEMRVEKWPADIRTQWHVFHTAYREQKKARKAEPAPAASTKPHRPS